MKSRISFCAHFLGRLLAVIALTAPASAFGALDTVYEPSVLQPSIEAKGGDAHTARLRLILDSEPSAEKPAQEAQVADKAESPVTEAQEDGASDIRWVSPKEQQRLARSDAPDTASEPAAQPEEPAESEKPAVKKQAETKKEQPQNTVPSFMKNPGKTPGLSVQQQRLRNKIHQVLRYYYSRPYNTRDRGPWEVMHWALAYEVHSKVLKDGPGGEPITSVGWLCFNQPCRNRNLMFFGEDGTLDVRVAPALQGHHGQLLSILALSRVSADYPMHVEGRQMTINDLVEREQRTCYPRTELTFKLIGLNHYLPSDATWVNDQGMAWDLPRLVSEEIRQPVRGAACGGIHRLIGLSLAYKKREQLGEPVDGVYLQAKQLVQKHQNYAYRLQNSDGSLSTEWFRGPGSKPDIDRRLKTTGHTLEWLMYAASEKDLGYWRTTKAVNYLANLLLTNRYRDWDAGELGHAIHALVLYDRLVFQKAEEEAANSSEVASGKRSGGNRR